MKTLTANPNSPIVDFSNVVLADLVPANNLVPEKKPHTLTPIVGDFIVGNPNPDRNDWVVDGHRVVTLEEFNSGL